MTSSAPAPAAHLCPCVTFCELDLIYGTHPLDPFFFGTLAYCDASGRVRCCRKDLFGEMYGRHDALVRQSSYERDASDQKDATDQEDAQDKRVDSDQKEASDQRPRERKQFDVISPVYQHLDEGRKFYNDESPIPCAERESCAKVYGSDVLDILKHGVVGPCKDHGRVR